MSEKNLEQKLRSLKFNFLAKNLNDFVSQATKNQFGPMRIIEQVADHEIKDRDHQSLERRIKTAKHGHFRPFSDFDWNWPEKIDRSQVASLFDLKFIADHANIIIIGPSGVGKTMLAKNIVNKAIIEGHSALFCTAEQLISSLEDIDGPRSLKARLNYYSRPQILAIDELGYLSYTHKAADLLFQLLAKRHETSSTIITTNIAFTDWGPIFSDAGSLVPLIDRLTHICEIISIEGKSYRTKESQERSRKKRSKKIDA